MARRFVVAALPHLAAEAALRREGFVGLAPAGEGEGSGTATGSGAATGSGMGQGVAGRPFALVAELRGALRLASVDPAAAALGLFPGMALADARAICPRLLTRPADPLRTRLFLAALVRWAGRFAPLVAAEAPDGGEDPEAAVGGVRGGAALVLDVTGCAHLFGGEAAMLAEIGAGLAGLGLTARLAMADTRGAAWALAHYAPATVSAAAPGAPVIAPPGHARTMIEPLPAVALRLPAALAAELAALGLATIGDLARLPRGALGRRFGLAVLRRLDQALGAEPEPVAAAPERAPLAARLTLPEPIGLVADLAAALERLLARLCARLEREGLGARRLCLTLRRVDGADARVEVALARPGREVARIARLFRPKLEAVEAGFGIDALRLEAVATEPLAPLQLAPVQLAPDQLVPARPRGPAEGDAPGGGGPGDGERGSSEDGALGQGREGDAPDAAGVESAPFVDLLSRLGNRIGFDRLLRFLPAESHIPERAFALAAAAWSAPEPFPAGGPPRPLVLFPPEPVILPPAGSAAIAAAGAAGAAGAGGCGDGADGTHAGGGAGKGIGEGPPVRFRWRGHDFTRLAAEGPERLAPEWWWDDPAWASGLRDYWRVATAEGPRLWLFHTPQAARPAWFVHGIFA